ATRSLSRYLSPLDNYPFWTLPAIHRGIRVARAEGVDLILATGNPFNSFMAARYVGRRFDVPYVVDFRDAWTFDQFTGELKPGATEVALTVERQVLHHAAAVIAVNQAILDWLIHTHSVPRRVRRLVVENGYDGDLIDPELAEGYAGRTLEEMRDSGPRFAYVGTVIPDKLDWESLFRRWADAQRLVPYEVSFDMYGHLGFSSQQAEAMNPVFRSDGVRHHGSIPKTEVWRVYKHADALVLPMYSSPFVTSGKVYEMMATGKPILALGPDTAGAMKPLRGYPKLVFSRGRDPREVARAIQAAVMLAANSPKALDRAAIDYASRFERARLIRPLMNLLDGVVNA
ncbi:MAG TPA: glycosyltransferase, partial [Acidimicrobiia bacterium]|nr:glycosyltransferase [Acidimicrobiia bacterium]